MLSENLKNLRKAKGLSQEELGMKCHVVRQTISKWEKGLSVPDSELLIRLAEVLDVSVGQLLGEETPPAESDQLQVLAAKLELLNEQFARKNESRRKLWRGIFFAVGGIALLMLLMELISHLYGQYVMHSLQDELAIIGGADGPTEVFVARSSGGTSVITVAFLAIVAVVGLWKTRSH